MDFSNITEALIQPWTRIYVRVLAAVLAYGGLVHMGNMLGLNGLPWTESQLHFRIIDVVLLAFNVVVGLGLWLRQSWAVVAFTVGMVLFQTSRIRCSGSTSFSAQKTPARWQGWWEQ